MKVFLLICLILLGGCYPNIDDSNKQTVKESIFDYFALWRITKVTVTSAPKGDFNGNNVILKSTTDKEILSNVEVILKRLPSTGSVYKDFPRDIDQWKIELFGENTKSAVLHFYGIRLRTPKTEGGSFYMGPTADEKVLLELVKKIVGK
ncbi:MAG: hypothetical protein A2W23_09775 [Planctomycetes bacterium RBG_16_43_13]|nr:MAG: hypothetical protein A2W23_09775 [Planctomycetes bacterium RBG_16_43_13]